MVRRESKLAPHWWAIAACFLALGIGYIHHRWFYPLEFHGDAAALHVLAKAILEEGSLLPSNFSYGNQIIFLRSSWLIALVSAFGLTGMDAFVVGSSLTIAFWGTLLYFFLSAFFDSHSKGVLFMVLLLLPFGVWESDLVLGQQSHLANVVLCLGLVISVSLYISRKSRLFFVAAGACLFVMSAEAPIRGLLVLGPLLVALLCMTGLRRAVAIAMPMGVLFVAAFLLNKWLVHLRPLELRLLEVLSFSTSDDIVNNLGRTSKEALGSIWSMYIIAGDRLSLGGFLVLGAGLLLIAGYLGFIWVGVREAANVAAARLDQSPQVDGVIDDKDSVRLVRLTSIFGLVLGAVAVATLNPDSARHYFWSIFIAKLFVLRFVFDHVSGFSGGRKAAAVAAVLAFFMSSWFAYLVHLHWNTTKIIRLKHGNEMVRSVEEVSRKTGIKNIYGEDFWHLMPLNTLVPGINAQALRFEDGEIRPFLWLSMPSWSCVKGDVLYYLKGTPVDEELRKGLVDAGGMQLKSGAGYSLWQGPPLWNLSPASKCYQSSLAYEGPAFSALPYSVGVRSGNARKTDGNAGFLVFGPYTSLQSGTYDLTIHGASGFVDGAYMEIVSKRGKVVHGRFSIEKFVKGPVLLKTTVKLSSGANELELRVWVGKQDAIELTGYSFMPRSNK